MKSITTVIGAVIVGIVIVLIVLGVVNVLSAHAERELAFQSVFADLSVNHEHRHFLIYIDIDACLACTEDMAAWIELEKDLPLCSSTFSIYAPASDSFDVAYAMELEGLSCTVRVLNKSEVTELGLTGMRTPVKILLDSLARPIQFRGAMGNREESKRYAEQILRDVCKNL